MRRGINSDVQQEFVKEYNFYRECRAQCAPLEDLAIAKGG